MPYRDLDKRRATNRRYEQSEKGRATKRDRSRRYEQSEKGRAYRQAYRQGEKWRAATRKYKQSERGRARDARYARTERGRYVYARAQAVYALKALFGGPVPPEVLNMAIEAWECKRLLKGCA